MEFRCIYLCLVDIWVGGFSIVGRLGIYLSQYTLTFQPSLLVCV